jgi:cellulose synthase (UDP-forming)
VFDSWLNIPDVVELELLGDYGARAFLTAQLVRGVPLNDSQTLLIADFLEPTQEQLDALCLVLYSDVREWYAQTRQQVDDPLGSLKFIASGLNRAFRDPQPLKGVKVRKRLQVSAQLFWEGHFYPAIVTEMGVQSLRLVLAAAVLPNWDSLQRQKPIVGLLLAAAGTAPERLLAIIDAVEMQPTPDSSENQVAIELRLPSQIQPQQEPKIKQLLAVTES